MSARPVRFDRGALAEARQARRWYAERSPAAVAGFVDEIEHALRLIAQAPERWPLYETGTRRLVLQRYPYALVYRPFADHVQIVAVAHTSRQPGYWSRRR